MSVKGKKPLSPKSKDNALKPGRSRKGQGAMPLAESRGSASGGVWGNAPTAPRATSMPNVSNKGAGSEASLPVTSRVLRRAPKLLFSTFMLCRARWARPISWSFKRSRFFSVSRGFRRCGGDQRAMKTDERLRSPFGNLRRAHYRIRKSAVFASAHPICAQSAHTAF